MNPKVDIVVVGAGIIGLTAAIALRQRGYRVTVLEARSLEPQSIENPRVYALNQASQSLLESIGVWDKISPISVAPYERMRVWDAHGGASIGFDARMLARDRLGVIIEEPPLTSALLAEALHIGVTLVAHWQMQTIESRDDGMVLRSPDQAWWASKVIVADGARSHTRDLLQVPVTTWSYDQHAIVAKVAVARAHDRTAYQVFCPQGPLAFLPLADSHQCSIVWSTSVAHAEELMASSDDVFTQALQTAFEQTLGDVKLLSQRQVFPLQMRHVKQYAGKHWVLMGDAAHTIHPLAGLGLNLGLADVTALLASLVGSQPPSARILRRYHRHRLHAVWQMILFLQSMHLLFTQSYLPIKMIRGLGLKACDRLPALKRFLIAQACGGE